MTSPYPPTTARPTPAARRTLARPTPGQRARVRELLADCPGLTDGADLHLVYAPQYAAEAAWICAQARVAGVRVRLDPVRGTAARVAERVRAAAAPGGTTVVLSDLPLDLPPGALHLPGAPGTSPVDLWRPRAAVDRAAEDLVRTLGRELVVVTGGGHTLRAGVGGVVRDRPPGTVEVAVTGAGGTFVADAAIAVNTVAAIDARLAARPVRVGVEQGVVTSVDCPDPHLALLLRRALHTHRLDRVVGVRFGVHPARCPFGAVAGPVNARRPGVTLRLRVDPGRAYSPASADLAVDLTATWEEGRT
jgi:hypothetical protein